MFKTAAISAVAIATLAACGSSTAPVPSTDGGVVAPVKTSAPVATPKSTQTVSQGAAVQAAKNYIGDGEGFSRAGLIAQLDSPYGGQFSVADATYGADNSGANWTDQAKISAKNYMSDGEGFSKASLTAQLTSPYGGQFTAAQAAAGVASVGL